MVLTGEGADELFGGYPRYYIPRLLQRIRAVPGFLRAPMAAALALAPDSRMRKLAHFSRQSMREERALEKLASGRHFLYSFIRTNGSPT